MRLLAECSKQMVRLSVCLSVYRLSGRHMCDVLCLCVHVYAHVYTLAVMCMRAYCAVKHGHCMNTHLAHMSHLVLIQSGFVPHCVIRASTYVPRAAS